MSTGTFDPREIGYNNDVDVGGRVLHVQTEVVGRVPKIRTMVLDRGSVVHSESQPYPEGELDKDSARALVEACHRGVVAKVSGGLIS